MSGLALFAQIALEPGSIDAAPSLKVWAYVGFLALVLGFLALDLGVFHRDAHEVSVKEAAWWSAIWISCGLLFSGFVYWAYNAQWLGLGTHTQMYNTPEAVAAGAALITTGTVGGLEAAKQYLSGFAIEKSLALDNIFVIALIFGAFAIPAKYQHRVLFWGILGALVMRGGLIFAGAGAIMKFQWILIFFGLFLLVTAAKMAIMKSHADPSNNMLVRMCKRVFPMVDFYDGQRFLTRRTLPPTYSTSPSGKLIQEPAPHGSLATKWSMTPLLLALVLVEFTDLVFAVDSIPAIFAITPDPFIVLTSNVFAMLGLRSLYFCLAAAVNSFRFLKPALVTILAFVGVKLLLLSAPPYLGMIGLSARPPIKIDSMLSLLIVVGLLTVGIVLSVLLPRKSSHRAA